MSLPPIPDPSGWVLALLRAGDAMIAYVERFRCGHHWHMNLPPGGGDISVDTAYACCCCPARRSHRPADPGRRECTRYTP